MNEIRFHLRTMVPYLAVACGAAVALGASLAMVRDFDTEPNAWMVIVAVVVAIPVLYVSLFSAVIQPFVQVREDGFQPLMMAAPVSRKQIWVNRVISGLMGAVIVIVTACVAILVPMWFLQDPDFSPGEKLSMSWLVMLWPVGQGLVLWSCGILVGPFLHRPQALLAGVGLWIVYGVYSTLGSMAFIALPGEMGGEFRYWITQLISWSVRLSWIAGCCGLSYYLFKRMEVQ